MRFSVKEQVEQNDPIMAFTMHLLHAASNAHILHWTTRSYAEHQALGTFYEELPDLLDAFVEAFQGKYGLLHDFVADYKVPGADATAYLEMLKVEVETLRRAPGFPQDQELQNEVDNIANLINSTLYKLRFLA